MISRFGLALALLIFGCVGNASAKHIVGGEIYYTPVGPNQYRITMYVYRDCKSGGAALDNPARIAIFEGANSAPFQTVDLALTSATTIPINNPNPCLATPTGICVEKGVYETTVTLPFSANGYTITYQRCCRNNSIANLLNPGDQGATYSIFLSGVAQQLGLACPQFGDLPPVFVCVNEKLSYNHSAISTGFDSVVYRFCAPLIGFDTGQPGGSPGGMPSRTPDPPPYVQVAYTSSYSGSNPMGGAPSVSINHYTGRISGYPVLQGQYVVGVCAYAYKGGVLISTIQRDFQFNVTNCPRAVNASLQADSITSPKVFVVQKCGSKTVHFTNTSTALIAITGYLWTFSINGTNTTSTDNNPIITFPNTGTYYGTLVANPNSPQCTDTAKIIVHIADSLRVDFTFAPPGCANTPVQFTDKSVTKNGSLTAWIWNYHDGTPIGTTQNPAHSFAQAGTFGVVLTVKDAKGCVDTMHRDVQFYPKTNIQITAMPQSGCAPLNAQFVNTSTPTNGYTIRWNFGDGTTSNTLAPAHVYTNVGAYGVSFQTISPTGCLSHDTFPNYIRTGSPPTAAFTLPSIPACNNTPILFTNASTQGTAPLVHYSWDFDDGATDSIPSPLHRYNLAGDFHVLLTITDTLGCSDTVSHVVNWYPAAHLALDANPRKVCLPAPVVFINSSYPTNGYTHTWDFGDGQSSTDHAPTHQYANPGSYSVHVRIVSPTGCIADTTMLDFIAANNKPQAAFGYTSDICKPLPIAFRDSSTRGTGVIKSWLWTFGDGLTDTIRAPIHPYVFAGGYNVTLHITDTKGCRDSATRLVKWYPSAKLNLPEPPNREGCTPVIVHFGNRSTPLNGYDVKWTFGDGITSADTAPTHTYTRPGLYDVSVKITSPSGCVSDSAFSNFILAKPVPVAAFAYNPSNPSNFEPKVRFLDQSINATGWHWSFGTGATSIARNPTYTYADTGRYVVKLIVTSPSTCRDSATQVVDIVPKFLYFLPNAFTPDGDGINDEFLGKGELYAISYFNLAVFNRWGELLWETHNPTEGWNGRKHNEGQMSPNGAYVYLLTIHGGRGTVQEERGTVMLLR